MKDLPLILFSFPDITLLEINTHKKVIINIIFLRVINLIIFLLKLIKLTNCTHHIEHW